MAYLLSDIFIGEFPITQNFGARPEVYSARYGIKGHNGEDYGCPSMTPIVSAAEGWVSEIGSKDLGTFDSGGYGNYIKVVHDGYLTLYGHLNDIQVKKGDRVLSGQLIAHSNNTGNSDAPHLHFGVAPCDGAGVKTEADNGYSGYIDPMSDRCHWEVKNLTAPVTSVSNQEEKQVTIKEHEFLQSVAQGTNYKVIVSFLQGHGLNTFLNASGMESIDFNANPTDPTGGERVNNFLAHLIQELKDSNSELTQTRINPSPTPLSDQVNNLPLDQKTSLLQNLLSSIKGFIFEQK